MADRRSEATVNATSSTTSDLAQRIRAAVQKHPNAMTMQLAHELGVAEADVIRAFPDGRAVELDIGRWEELIRNFEDLGELHVIVSNGAATLEAVGSFGNFSTWGDFFNVQTQTLDMHIRWPNLGSIFAVEKPSHMNGVGTCSVQLYDRDGHAAVKVFFNFGGLLAPERAAAFQRLRQEFRKPA
jgi:putative heme iron utilization protein